MFSATFETPKRGQDKKVRDAIKSKDWSDVEYETVLACGGFASAEAADAWIEFIFSGVTGRRGGRQLVCDEGHVVSEFRDSDTE